MAVQTSYSNEPLTALKGSLADNGQAQAHDVEPGEMTAAAVVGNLVSLSVPTAGDVDCASVTPLAELTVSANAILAATASAATPLTVTSASTPALTVTAMNPARRITAVLNSHADWNATTMKIYGEAWDGSPICDVVQIPDAGNTTVTSHSFFRRVTKVILDAQGGTGGSFTMGYSADEGIYDPETVGVLVRDISTEPLSGDNSDEYAAGEQVNVLKSGKIYVETEATVSARGPAYLRTATSGADVRGQWSSGPGTGFTVQPWAELVTADDAATVKIAVLRKKF
jgi:hypothetical protein